MTWPISYSTSDTNVVDNGSSQSGNRVFVAKMYLKCFYQYLDTMVQGSVHYSDVIMSAMPSQITGVSIVCLAVCLGADQRNIKVPRHCFLLVESTGSPMDSPHKGPVTQKMFPFDDVIMHNAELCISRLVLDTPLHHQTNAFNSSWNTRRYISHTKVPNLCPKQKIFLTRGQWFNCGILRNSKC